jgi:hypothetical protein
MWNMKPRNLVNLDLSAELQIFCATFALKSWIRRYDANQADEPNRWNEIRWISVSLADIISTPKCEHIRKKWGHNLNSRDTQFSPQQ